MRDRRILELVDHFQSAVRVGDEVHELRSVLAPLPDKLSALEQRDPSNLSFAQAAKLVGMGATVDELTQSCGLFGEAQLMSRLLGQLKVTSCKRYCLQLIAGAGCSAIRPWSDPQSIFTTIWLSRPTPSPPALPVLSARLVC